MLNFFFLTLSSIFTHNLILNKFIGLCYFANSSNNVKNIFKILLPTMFVIIMSSTLSWLINDLILIPLNLIFLRVFVIIFIISMIVQLTELLMRKLKIIIYSQIGCFLPLITTNCMILFITLINVMCSHSFFESMIFSVLSIIGYFLVTVFFIIIKERLYLSNIPFPFQGAPIIFITIGLMSLIFIGLIF